MVLEAILGTSSTPKHPLSNHPEFRTLQHDLLLTRRNGKRKRKEKSVPV